jgi:hypothetical protein
MADLAFWQTEEFAPFIPYLRAVEHRRCDLSSQTPPNIMAAALLFEARCVACGDSIRPFRRRAAMSPRGPRPSPIYLAMTCPSDVKPGCSRGNRASAAYESLMALEQGRPQPPQQARLI